MSNANRTLTLKGFSPLRRKLSVAIAAQLLWAAGAQAGPEGGTVVGGAGSISQNGLNTTIKQDTDKLAIDWQSFNVNVNEKVEFIQPSSSSLALNRILSNEGSKILGNIEANGHVILMNPNGVFFGKDAQINVGGLVASGLAINPDDFMNGDFAFSAVEGADGAVINLGLINAATGGNVVLQGQSVDNQGLISAKLGSVTLAAGKESVLTFDDTGMIGVRVSQEVLQSELGMDAAVSNSGDINAEGGKVLLTGSVSEDIFTSAVNAGEMQPKTSVLMHEDGSFTLGGGADVVNTGNIDVSSNLDAGDVVVIGENVTHTGSIKADALNADGSQAAAGHIELHAQNTTLVKATGELSAEAQGAGTGGDIKVLGDRVGLFEQASVNASGETGGGTVNIGGGFQGKNPQIRNADKTIVHPEALIQADAITQGDGGEVIVWADGATAYAGTITATGGDTAGDGGFVEVSGKKGLSFTGEVDLLSKWGQNGALLLDPETITIVFDPSLTNVNVGANGELDFDNAPVDAEISGNAVGTLLDGADLWLKATDLIDLQGSGIYSASTNNLILESGGDISGAAAVIEIGGDINLMAGVADCGASTCGHIGNYGNIDFQYVGLTTPQDINIIGESLAWATNGLRADNINIIAAYSINSTPSDGGFLLASGDVFLSTEQGDINNGFEFQFNGQTYQSSPTALTSKGAGARVLFLGEKAEVDVGGDFTVRTGGLFRTAGAASVGGITDISAGGDVELNQMITPGGNIFISAGNDLSVGSATNSLDFDSGGASLVMDAGNRLSLYGNYNLGNGDFIVSGGTKAQTYQPQGFLDLPGVSMPASINTTGDIIIRGAGSLDGFGDPKNASSATYHAGWSAPLPLANNIQGDYEVKAFEGAESELSGAAFTLADGTAITLPNLVYPASQVGGLGRQGALSDYLGFQANTNGGNFYIEGLSVSMQSKINTTASNGVGGDVTLIARSGDLSAPTINTGGGDVFLSGDAIASSTTPTIDAGDGSVTINSATDFFLPNIYASILNLNTDASTPFVDVNNLIDGPSTNIVLTNQLNFGNIETASIGYDRSIQNSEVIIPSTNLPRDWAIFDIKGDISVQSNRGKVGVRSWTGGDISIKAPTLMGPVSSGPSTDYYTANPTGWGDIDIVVDDLLPTGTAGIYGNNVSLKVNGNDRLDTRGFISFVALGDLSIDVGGHFENPVNYELQFGGDDLHVGGLFNLKANSAIVSMNSRVVGADLTFGKVDIATDFMVNGGAPETTPGDIATAGSITVGGDTIINVDDATQISLMGDFKGVSINSSNSIDIPKVTISDVNDLSINNSKINQIALGVSANQKIALDGNLVITGEEGGSDVALDAPTIELMGDVDTASAALDLTFSDQLIVGSKLTTSFNQGLVISALGSAQANTVTILSSASIGDNVTGTIDLLGGNDTVIIKDAIPGLGNITFNGGAGQDTFDASGAGRSSWTVTGTNAGQFYDVAFTGFETAIAQGGDVQLANATNSVEYFGNSEFVVNKGLRFKNISDLKGGSQADTFIVGPGISPGSIDGGADRDTLRLTANIIEQDIVELGLVVDGFPLNTKNIENLEPNVGVTLTNTTNANATWTLTGASTVIADVGGSVINFSKVASIVGGTGADNFIFYPDGLIGGGIDGGGGADHISSFEAGATYRFNNDLTGTLENNNGRVISFKNIATFSGQGKVYSPNVNTNWTINYNGGGALQTDTGDRVTFSPQFLSVIYAGTGSDIFNVDWASGLEIHGGDGLDKVTLVENGMINGFSFYGDGGDDTFIFESQNSAAGAVDWQIDQNGVATLRDNFRIEGVENLVGGDQADNFTLSPNNTVTSISGAGGVNSLDVGAQDVTQLYSGSVKAVGANANISVDQVQNVITTGLLTIEGDQQGGTWNITGDGSGEYLLVGNTFPFTGADRLVGGGGPDTFVFAQGGVISSGVDGGGDATIGGEVDIWRFNDDLISGTVENTAGATEFENMGSGGFYASNSGSELFGPNVDTNWDVTFRGFLTLSAGGNSAFFTISPGTLHGGTGTDQFTVETGNNVRINAGGGDDQIRVTVGAIPTESFGDINGGMGTDTLIVQSPNEVPWTITGKNTGTVWADSPFQNIENLTGSATQNDSFTFERNGVISGTVDGVGTGTIQANAGGEIWRLNQDFSGSLESTAGVTDFTGMSLISGGDEVFSPNAYNVWSVEFNGAGRIETQAGDSGIAFNPGTLKVIHGGNQSDVFNLSDPTGLDVYGDGGNDTFNITNPTNAGNRLFGGAGIDDVNVTVTTAPGAGIEWQISGNGDAQIGAGYTATEMENFGGGDQTDRFVFAADALVGTVSGGAGNDTFDIAQGVSIVSLLGGAGDDSVIYTGTAAVNDMDLGADIDTLDISALNATALVTATNVGAFLNTTFASAPEIFIGPNYGNVQPGSDEQNIWRITGEGEGSLTYQENNQDVTLYFTGKTQLTGGAGDDIFYFESADAWINGNAGIIGGAGDNSIEVTANGIVANWLINGNDAGELTLNNTNQTTLFDGIAQLIGGTGQDNFTLAQGGSITSVDGGVGPGINTLTISHTGDANWNLGGLNSVTGISDFLNIQNVVGGTGTDTFNWDELSSVINVDGGASVTDRIIAAGSNVSVNLNSGTILTDTEVDGSFQNINQIDASGAATATVNASGSFTIGSTSDVDGTQLTGFNGFTGASSTYTIVEMGNYDITDTGGDGSLTVNADVGGNIVSWRLSTADGSNVSVLSQDGAIANETTFSGMAQLAGSPGVDVLNLADFDILGNYTSIDAGGGNNQLHSPDVQSTRWDVDDQGVSLNNSFKLAGFTELYGSNQVDVIEICDCSNISFVNSLGGDDKFILGNNVSISYIDAGDGNDTFSIEGNITADLIEGGAGDNKIVLDHGSNTAWTLGETNMFSNIAKFSNIAQIEGSRGNDTVTWSSASDVKSFNAGGGDDSLANVGGVGSWKVNTTDSTLSESGAVLTFNGFETLVGSDQGDAYLLNSIQDITLDSSAAKGTLATTVNGELTWDITDSYIGAVTDVANNTTTNFTGIEFINSDGTANDAVTFAPNTMMGGISVGAGDDSITLADAVDAGVLSPGAGNDVINLSGLSLVVDILNVPVPGSGVLYTLADLTDDFEQTIRTGSSTAVVSIDGYDVDWQVAADGTLTVDYQGALTDSKTFDNVVAITGADGTDNFNLADGAVLTGGVDGGAGLNTLTDASNAGTWALNEDLSGSLQTTAGDTPFDNINVLSGGGSLIAPDANAEWDINAGGAGTLTVADVSIDFYSGLNFTAGSMDDTVRVSADYNQAGDYSDIVTFDAGAGNNVVQGPDADMVWDITGAATYKTTPGLVFNNLTRIEGGTGSDQFVVYNNAALMELVGNVGALAAGENNQISFADASAGTDVQWTLTDVGTGTVTADAGAVDITFSGVQTIASPETVTGTNQLAITTAEDLEWTLTAADAGVVQSADATQTWVTYSNITSLAGGTGDDVLVGLDQVNTWNINAGGQGDLNQTTTFANMDSFIGGDDADTFNVAGGSNLGFIWGQAGDDVVILNDGVVTRETLLGGDGDDTLDMSSLTTAQEFNFDLNAFSDGLQQEEFEEVIASEEGFAFYAGAGDVDWQIAADGSFSITKNGQTYDIATGYATLRGGDGDNTFNLAGANSAIETIEGSANGNNTLTATELVNTWLIDGVNSGTLNSDGAQEITFSAIANLIGGLEVDNFTIATGGTVASIVGGEGGDALVIADDNITNDWIIGASSSVASVTRFTGIEAITGNINNDTFTFVEATDVTSINAGDGIDTLNLEAYGSADVNINSGIAGNIDFASTENFVVDIKALATFTGLNENGVWTVGDAGTVNYASTGVEYSFAGFAGVIGGTGDDAYTLNSMIHSITDAGGNDSLILAATPTNGALWVVNGVGNTYLSDVADVETITDATPYVGTTDGQAIYGMETITGSGANDAFIIADPADMPVLDGGLGDNNLVVATGDNTWVINDTTTTLNGTDHQNFAYFAGGDQADNFTVANTTLGNLYTNAGDDSVILGEGVIPIANTALDGGVGDDTLDMSGLTTAQIYDYDTKALKDGLAYDNFEVIAPSDAGFAFDAGAGDVNWDINGDGSFTITKDGVTSGEQSGYDILIGGDGENVFVLTGTNTYITAIQGSDTGNDTLTASNLINDWLLTGANSGTLTGDGANAITFSAIANLVGGADVDTFTAQEGSSFASISGGAGVDHLQLDAFTTQANNQWDLGANSSLAFDGTSIVASFDGIEQITGNDNNNALSLSAGSTVTRIRMGAGDDELAINGLDAEIDLINNTLNGTVQLEGLEQYQADPAQANTLIGLNEDADWQLANTTDGTVTFATSNQTVTFGGFNNLEAGTGIDTLTKTDAIATDWQITEANAGAMTAASTTTFSGVEQVTSGAGDDTFTLASLTASLESLDGGDGNDTLQGADQTNTWAITGTGVGSVEGLPNFTNVENLVGGSAVDTFDLAAGVQMGDISGGAGDDQFNLAQSAQAGVLAGDAGDDTFVLNSGVIVTRVDGGDHNIGDTLDLFAFGAAVEIDFLGNENSAVVNTNIENKVLDPDQTAFFGGDGDNLWEINAEGTGTLTKLEGEYANQTFVINPSAKLRGGDGDDTFVFVEAGNVTGSVDGGAGDNTLQSKDLASDWLITGVNSGELSSDDGTGTLFANIANLIGADSAVDTFTVEVAGAIASLNAGASAGDNLVVQSVLAANWSLGSASQMASGTVQTQLLGLETITAGDGDDTVVVVDAASPTTTFDGGAGVNTWDTTALAAPVTLDLTANTVDTVNTAGFSGFSANGTVDNTLVGVDADSTWAVTGTGAGTVSTAGNTVSFDGFNTLNAGSGKDEITFAGGSVATLDAGAGDDTLTANNAANTWALGANSGTLASGTDATAFSNVEALVGGTESDDFTLAADATGVTSLDGAGGVNSLSGPDVATDWLLTSDFAGSVMSVAFSNIQTLFGGVDADTFTIADDITVGEIYGGAGNDYFDIGFGVTGDSFYGDTGDDEFHVGRDLVLSGYIDAGADGKVMGDLLNLGLFLPDPLAETLQEEVGFNFINFIDPDEILPPNPKGEFDLSRRDTTNVWYITGDQAGRVEIETATGVRTYEFTEVHTLRGGGGDDTFIFETASPIEGMTFDGGASIGTGDDVLTGQDLINQWLINGVNSGTFTTEGAAEANTFMGIASIIGGNQADTFTIEGAGSIANVSGAAGADTLVANTGVANTWSLSPTATTLNTTTGFAEIEQLVGGDLADTFDLSGPLTDVVQIDGAAGSDVLNLLNTAPAVVDLQTQTVDGLAFIGIDTLAGTAAGSVLQGADVDTVWSVTGDQTGAVAFVSPVEGNTVNIGFEGFADLEGGSAEDTLDVSTLTTDTDITLAGNDATVDQLGVTLASTDAVTGSQLATTTLHGASDQAYAWTIDGVRAGRVAPQGQTSGLSFNEVGAIVGGDHDDAFTVTEANSRVALDGGGQASADTVDYSGANGNVTVRLVSTLDGSTDAVTGIERVQGNNRGSESLTTAELVAGDTNNTWTIGDLDGAGEADGVNDGELNNGLTTVAFTDFNILTGGNGEDSFVQTNGIVVGALNGGAGNDSLVATVQGANPGTQFNGGAGSDTLTIEGATSEHTATYTPGVNGAEFVFAANDETYRVSHTDVETLAENSAASNLVVKGSAAADILQMINGGFIVNGTNTVNHSDKQSVFFDVGSNDVIELVENIQLPGTLRVRNGSVMTNNPTNASISADALVLDTVGSVGELNARIRTDVNTLQVTNGIGDIALEIQNGVDIGESSFTGALDLVALTGDITSNAAISGSGDLTLNVAAGNITLAGANAIVGDASLLAANGDVLLNNTANAGVVTRIAQLQATNASITSGSHLFGLGEANVSGDTQLAAGGDIAFESVVNDFNHLAISDANNVSLVDQNQLIVDGITASGTVKIRSIGLEVAQPVVGADLNLDAGSGSAQLDADLTATQGNVAVSANRINQNGAINAPKGAVTLNANTTVDQKGSVVASNDVNINAATGDVVMDSDSSINSDAGNVYIIAGNDAIVSNVSTQSEVTVNATQGSVVDGNGTESNVTGSKLTATANSGVGSTDALETTVDSVDVNTNTGNVGVSNTGSLVVDAAKTGDGSVSLKTSDDLELKGNSVNAGGNESVVELVSVNANVKQTGPAGEPAVTASTAIVRAPNGGVGQGGISFNVDKNLIIIAKAKAGAITNSDPTVIPVERFSSSYKFEDQLVNVEPADELNPSIFIKVKSYFHNDISLRLPIDQLYDVDEDEEDY